MRHRVVFIVIVLAVFAAVSAYSQDLRPNTPSGVVKEFYELLHARKFAEGFRLSVFRPAIEGLNADEMKELEPDFERIAASLPDKVEVTGEKINGDRATVMIKLPNKGESQEVALLKSDGKWVIGEPESQKIVKKQGKSYFFNERMKVSESEITELLQSILGAELIYFKAKQEFTSLEELAKLGGVEPALIAGPVNGYKFELTLTESGKAFSVKALPTQYGRSGKLSFYSDQSNLIRAEDNGGKPATAAAPPYQPRVE